MTGEMLKGHLDLLLLSAVAAGPAHGYAIIERLRERGMIQPGGAEFVATEAGVGALGAGFSPLPTGAALREHWMGRLPEGERRVLEHLVSAYPDPVERSELDDATGYKRSSRDTYLQRLASRRLVVTEPGSRLRASGMLFD